MVGKLLSLYLRAGAGVANLTIRTAARGAEAAINILRTVLPSHENGSQEVAGDASEEPPAPTGGPRREPARYEDAPSAGADEPAVVDDDRELVAEFAEPGAEDGASAELEV